MAQASRKTAAKVGLFMLIGLLILFTGILTLGSMRKAFVNRFEVSAVFDEVNGLSKGDKVWLSGVKVGVVNDLEFIDSARVRVYFEIEEKSRQFIRENTRVKVSTDGLIGNPILLLTGGTAEAGMVYPGFEFPVEREDSQQDIMKTLQENNKNILAITTDLKGIIGDVRSGKGSVGKLLNDEALFANLSRTAATAESASRDFRKSASSLAALTDSVNAKGNLVHDMVTDKEIYPSVKKSVANLQNTAQSFEETSVTARQMVTDLHRTANDLLADTTSPVGVLLHDEETAGDIRQTIRNLETSTARFSENMEAIRHNFLFRRYFKKLEKEKTKQKEEAKKMTGTEQR